MPVSMSLYSRPLGIGAAMTPLSKALMTYISPRRPTLIETSCESTAPLLGFMGHPMWAAQGSSHILTDLAWHLRQYYFSQIGSTSRHYPKHTRAMV